MNYIPSIDQTINGQEVLTDPFSVDFLNRTITISGEIDDNVAATVNAAARTLARKSIREKITI